MKAIAAIIESDLKQRRFILWAALVFSVMPFLAAAIIPSWRTDPKATIGLFGAVLALNFPIAVALGLGVSMIGNDLSARRLSFYFSKPIPASSLWFGKLISALITVYGAMVIVQGPSLLYAWDYPAREWMDRRTIVAVAIVALPVLLLLMHVLGTMIRSRSAWIAVDAAGIAITAIAVYAIVKPLIEALAIKLFVVIAGSMIVATVAALAVSGAWHLSRGRTDRLANHVALSKFLWSSIAIILAIAGGYVAWLAHRSPSQIVTRSLYAAPSGPWVAAMGTLPGALDYRASALVNLENGNSVRLAASDLESGAIAYSRDGRRIAWTHATMGDRRVEIRTRSLDPSGAVRATGIYTTTGLVLVMSDDGQRLAYIDGGILNVADAATGRSLASVRVNAPSRWFSWLYFASDDVVRVIVCKEVPDARSEPRLNTVEISELDVRTRRLVQTGTFTVMARYLWAKATPDGSRLLIHTFKPADPADAFFVVDARTGARITSLAIGGNNAVPFNESVVWVARTANTLELIQQPMNGEAPARIDLGAGVSALIVGARGEHLLVTKYEHDSEVGNVEGLLINLKSRTIERKLPGVRLIDRQHLWEDDPRAFVSNGPLIAGLDKANHILRVDMNTGTVRPLPR